MTWSRILKIFDRIGKEERKRRNKREIPRERERERIREKERRTVEKDSKWERMRESGKDKSNRKEWWTMRG